MRGASWDNMPLPGFTIDDIDDAIVDKFKKTAFKKGRIPAEVLDESKEELMERLGLTNAGYYTNAVMHLKYMKAKIACGGVCRTERYFVPDEALREALLNALCHKQYESCVPIQVSVYENRIYIGNCCNLPPDWTADHLLKKHTSDPYNKAVANVFYLYGLIENWGRGTRG